MGILPRFNCIPSILNSGASTYGNDQQDYSCMYESVPVSHEK
jgi:hypothetical protein